MLRSVLGCFLILVMGIAHEGAVAGEVDDLLLQSQQLWQEDRIAEARPLAERGLALLEAEREPDKRKLSRASALLGQILHEATSHAAAESHLRRHLALELELAGPASIDAASALVRLGKLLRDVGRYVEAEEILKRAISIEDSVRGKDHPETTATILQLAWSLKWQGRRGEAAPLFEKVLEIRQRANVVDEAEVADAMNDLGLVYYELNREQEAEPLLARALAIAERTTGPDSYLTGSALNNMAMVDERAGRLGDAEQKFARSVAIFEKRFGADHPTVAQLLNNLGMLKWQMSLTGEAEELLKRSLAIRLRVFGPDHHSVAQTSANLGRFYKDYMRFADSEPLLQRALVIAEKVYGSQHLQIVGRLQDLADLYRRMGQTDAADTLSRRAIVIESKDPSRPPGISLEDFEAALTSPQKREAIRRDELAEAQKRYGPDSLNTARALMNLGEFILDERPLEAEPLFQRALDIRRRRLSEHHLNIGQTHYALGRVAMWRKNWAQAVEHYRASTRNVIDRARIGLLGPPGDNASARDRELGRTAPRFYGLIEASWRLAHEGGKRHELAREMFEMAQWSYETSAARSIAQMSARVAAQEPMLAAVVRERQNLVGERAIADRKFIEALGADTMSLAGGPREAIRDRMAAIDARLLEIARGLERDYPSYATMVAVEPAGIDRVQAALRPNEVLIVVLDHFIWLVGKTGAVTWKKAFGHIHEHGDIHSQVLALRCSLDPQAWIADLATCRQWLGTGYGLTEAEAGEAPPFSLEKAHELYRAYFGELESLIGGKDIVLVPLSGALVSVPPHVLVTEAPAEDGRIVTRKEDFRSAAWLARRNAITVMPSVSAFVALRTHAKASAASRPYLGIGNPLLTGTAFQIDAARAARERQSCAGGATRIASSTRSSRGHIAPLQRGSMISDLSIIRSQAPLPETADELCAVAGNIGDGDGDVRLGANATEAAIKAMSADGSLARHRIVHFATHGAVAGEIESGAEPGLILTPPAQATREDDGYLSASEIAGLHLDADWVLLSACNTAAAGAVGSEALSGLARAFFHAGARSLLVSQWAVNSKPTVDLISHAIAELARDPTTGRAEAMRRSMMAMVDRGAAGYAHPNNWAPFIVVGEGAALIAGGQGSR